METSTSTKNPSEVWIWAALSFLAPPCCGFRGIGQFQHLDSPGQKVDLLEPEGQDKGETGAIAVFLNPAVHTDPDYLDPVFIGMNINKKRIITDIHQHCQGNQEANSHAGSEFNRRKTEPLF
ncbi:MAG: hypothetical protein PF503_18485 [Desulfobacula sp.]|jgi:hypothetical protein|nr:hypothetical protein [Desulfobacula sp.]